MFQCYVMKSWSMRKFTFLVGPYTCNRNIEQNANSIKFTPAADSRAKPYKYYVIILVPLYGSGKINTLIGDGLAPN